MYNLAAPILYRRVVTDNLQLFLFRPKRISGTPIIGIITKQALLSSTQQLFVEYSHKTGLHQPRDTPIAKWVIEGLASVHDNEEDWEDITDKKEGGSEAVEMDYAIEFGKEVKSLRSVMERFYPIGIASARLKHPLPGLRTLAVGAFFGRQEQLAQIEHPLIGNMEEFGMDLICTQENFRKFIAGASRLDHICQSVEGAPLSFFTENSLPRYNTKRTSISVHSDCRSRFIHVQPSAVGSRTTWYDHNVSLDEWDNDEITNRVSSMLVKARLDRGFIADHWTKTPAGPKPDWDIACTLYRPFLKLPERVPSSRPHPPNTLAAISTESPPKSYPTTKAGKAKWRKAAAKVEEVIQKEIDAISQLPTLGVTVKDSVHIRPIFDAEKCRACGWFYQE